MALFKRPWGSSDTWTAAVVAALGAAGLALFAGSRPASQPTMTSGTQVPAGQAVRLDLAPVDPARGKDGTVYLVLELAAYDPGEGSGGHLIVRRLDGQTPGQLARLTLFPNEKFPSAARRHPERFQVRVGECKRTGDTACAPRIDVVLESRSTGPGGASMTLGRSVLEID